MDWLKITYKNSDKDLVRWLRVLKVDQFKVDDELVVAIYTGINNNSNQPEYITFKGDQAEDLLKQITEKSSNIVECERDLPKTTSPPLR